MKPLAGVRPQQKGSRGKLAVHETFENPFGVHSSQVCKENAHEKSLALMGPTAERQACRPLAAGHTCRPQLWGFQALREPGRQEMLLFSSFRLLKQLCGPHPRM